jgi:hypothetical protein
LANLHCVLLVLDCSVVMLDARRRRDVQRRGLAAGHDGEAEKISGRWETDPRPGRSRRLDAGGRSNLNKGVLCNLNEGQNLQQLLLFLA